MKLFLKQVLILTYSKKLTDQFLNLENLPLLLHKVSYECCKVEPVQIMVTTFS